MEKNAAQKNSNRFNHLLETLAQRRDELSRLIPERRGALENPGAASDAVMESADTAFHRSSAEVESGLIDRRLREIALIDAAEARMAAGTFGICVDCELPIDEPRLAANPTALRCLDCQAAHEKSALGNAPGAAAI